VAAAAGSQRQSPARMKRRILPFRQGGDVHSNSPASPLAELASFSGGHVMNIADTGARDRSCRLRVSGSRRTRGASGSRLVRLRERGTPPRGSACPVAFRRLRAVPAICPAADRD
jgi:hypothetical protein